MFEQQKYINTNKFKTSITLSPAIHWGKFTSTQSMYFSLTFLSFLRSGGLIGLPFLTHICFQFFSCLTTRLVVLHQVQRMHSFPSCFFSRQSSLVSFNCLSRKRICPTYSCFLSLFTKHLLSSTVFHVFSFARRSFHSSSYPNFPCFRSSNVSPPGFHGSEPFVFFILERFRYRQSI